jgi:hypothetical protein
MRIPDSSTAAGTPLFAISTEMPAGIRALLRMTLASRGAMSAFQDADKSLRYIPLCCATIVVR